MKINSHAGHGKQDSKSCGAVGLLKESVENRYINNDFIKHMRNENNTVYDTTCDYPNSQSDCINQIVKKCNSNNVDLDISIHFNSGRKDPNGDGKTGGVEVILYNDSAKVYADRVCKKISELGFTNRGIKYNKNLGVLANTKAPAMIIEVCFVDDKDDYNQYIKVKDKIGKAIAEGILNKTIIENNKTQEVFDMEKIVLYYGDADLFGAVIVAQKNRCPLMKKSDFDASKINVKEVIQIGGKKEDTDRFITFKNAAKLV